MVVFDFVEIKGILEEERKKLSANIEIFIEKDDLEALQEIRKLNAKRQFINYLILIFEEKMKESE